MPQAVLGILCVCGICVCVQVCVCVHVCAYMLTHVHMSTYIVQKSILGIFLIYSPPYFFLNLNFIYGCVSVCEYIVVSAGALRAQSPWRRS